jgi:hypothetical protein
MGFLGKVKGWLNIGGVSLKIAGVNPQIRRGRNEISGKALLTSGTGKQVLGVRCQVVNEHTYKKDGKSRTDTRVLGEQHFREGFEMKSGETREIPFSVSYFLKEKTQTGPIGTTSIVGALPLGRSDSYALVVSCDVKGTPLDPSARVKLKLV